MGWRPSQRDLLVLYSAMDCFRDDDIYYSLKRLISIAVSIAAKEHRKDCSGTHLVNSDGTVECLHSGAFIE